MALRIGVLHPGEMGISLAATALRSGHAVAWASEGRGAATRARAERHGLRDLGTIAALCAESDVVVSICPPHGAEALADAVADSGFGGLYLDANAISPARASQIGERLAGAGIAFVDGGIIGGPAWEPGRTWLYLSGPRAEDAAACFAAGPLETRVLEGDAGAASALKMCYAAYTKGTTALLCGVIAAAEQLGVRPALERQWEQDRAGSAAQNLERARQVTAKAWRFVGEMEEIASTFRAAGLPGEFHDAAAELYTRLAGFKGGETPPVEAVLAALLQGRPAPQA
jgi:3-hydroxyisobutyrate dehydrogenase-like beta-hydroxyacid dehydrogenase